MKDGAKRKMVEVVLDFSVLLAAIRKEVATDGLLTVVERGVMSAVNWCELHTKLYDYRLHDKAQTQSFTALVRQIHSFTQSQARIAADLRQATRAAGLSLGDRACIALAVELGAEVYTADRAWATVTLPCRVHLIR